MNKDAHVLITGSCVYGILHGKKDFSAVVKDLEMGQLY